MFNWIEEKTEGGFTAHVCRGVAYGPNGGAMCFVSYKAYPDADGIWHLQKHSEWCGVDVLIYDRICGTLDNCMIEAEDAMMQENFRQEGQR